MKGDRVLGATADNSDTLLSRVAHDNRRDGGR